jgi:hypothetical protein
MIEQVVPVVPVSKIAVAEATLSKVGFTLAWQHNPGQNLMYAEFTHPDGIAAQAGETAADQTWHMREFWLRDADGNAYRFGQPIES